MTAIGAVLVVDDDPDVLKAARLALLPEAARLDLASSPETIWPLLAEHGHDVLLLDMNFAAGAHDGAEGLGALDQARARDPHLAVVLMTAYGGVGLAVDALKRGGDDFLLKPWSNERLLATVATACALTRERRTAHTLDLDVVERRTIAEALRRTQGNISQAATALGLTRPALYRRMSKHGL